MSEILDQIDKLLNEFSSQREDIQGQIVIEYPQGVPIASTWRGTIDPILIGAVTAAVKLTFARLCQNLKKGNLKRIIVHNENGKIIIQNAGPKAILTTVLPSDADIYTVAFMTLNIANKIEKIMTNYVPV
ncbi:MAG: roadblock/LC7 domain-containing protein [Promethearchaeota archaeon]